MVCVCVDRRLFDANCGPMELARSLFRIANRRRRLYFGNVRSRRGQPDAVTIPSRDRDKSAHAWLHGRRNSTWPPVRTMDDDGVRSKNRAERYETRADLINVSKKITYGPIYLIVRIRERAYVCAWRILEPRRGIRTRESH